jgi:hypothetical protein
MVTLQSVLIDMLWIGGLTGLLATFSYTGWLRADRGGSWGKTLSCLRLLFPITVSLTLFCAGMALNHLGATSSTPVWETVAWSCFFLFFFIQSIHLGMAGATHGWDSSMEGIIRNDRPTL